MQNDFINGVRSCLSIPKVLADRLIAGMQKRKPEERELILDRLQQWNSELEKADENLQSLQTELSSALDQMEHAMDRMVRNEEETTEHQKESEAADNLFSNLSISPSSHG